MLIRGMHRGRSEVMCGTRGHALAMFLETRGHDLALLRGYFGAMSRTQGNATAMHRGRFRGVPRDPGTHLGHGLGLFRGDIRDSGAGLGLARGSFQGHALATHRGYFWAFPGTRSMLWHYTAVVLGAMCGTQGHALTMHRGHFRGVLRDLGACLGLATGLF